MSRVAAFAAAYLLATPAFADPARTSTAQPASAVVASAASAAPASPGPATPTPTPATIVSPPPPATPDPATAPRAAAPKPAAPKPVTLVARIDLTNQRMSVVVNGKPTHSFTISSGARDHATPAGTFRPAWMARVWHSRTYDLAPMPHSVFFNGGIAVHGTTWISQLGRPASKGCIRLAPANAKIFYDLVARHSLAQTRVVVTGWPKFHEPAIARGPDGQQRVAASRGLPPRYTTYQGGYQQPSGSGLFDTLFGPAPLAQVYAPPRATRLR